MSPRTLIIVAGLAAAIAAPGVASAIGGGNDYVRRTFAEPASRGLPVSKPLDEFVATSRFSLVMPRSWRPVGTTSFDEGARPCRYRIKLTVRSRLAAPGDAADRVEKMLPGASAAYVLDVGERRAGAFRVVRKAHTTAGIEVDARWSGVLTRRKDIAPGGKVAWTDVSVAATSFSGDECHSGTYRERLGPEISDALATARTSLKFLDKP